MTFYEVQADEYGEFDVRKGFFGKLENAVAEGKRLWGERHVHGVRIVAWTQSDDDRFDGQDVTPENLTEDDDE